MPQVRQAAARSITSLGDTALVEDFVDAIAKRDRDDERAKAAAYALGALGDVRGIEALVDALSVGWKPTVTVEALSSAGTGVITTVIERVMQDPALSKRQGMISPLQSQPHDALRASLSAGLDRLHGTDKDSERAMALLRLADCRDELHRELATQIKARTWGASKEAAALLKAADKALEPKKKPAKS